MGLKNSKKRQFHNICGKQFSDWKGIAISSTACGMNELSSNWWTCLLANILAVCKLPKQDRNWGKDAICRGRANEHYQLTTSAGEQESERKIKLFDLKSERYISPCVSDGPENVTVVFIYIYISLNSLKSTRKQTLRHPSIIWVLDQSKGPIIFQNEWIANLLCHLWIYYKIIVWTLL